MRLIRKINGTPKMTRGHEKWHWCHQTIEHVFNGPTISPCTCSSDRHVINEKDQKWPHNKPFRTAIKHLAIQQKQIMAVFSSLQMPLKIVHTNNTLVKWFMRKTLQSDNVSSKDEKSVFFQVSICYCIFCLLLGFRKQFRICCSVGRIFSRGLSV